jgi:hypothetical protein
MNVLSFELFESNDRLLRDLHEHCSIRVFFVVMITTQTKREFLSWARRIETLCSM